MGITIPKQLSSRIEDGVHTGKVVRVEERTQPFAYVDFIISIDGNEKIELKYGCPASIICNKDDNAPVSKLAKVCEVLGILDEQTQVENAIGKSIQFQTISETTKDGTFARVVDGSIKLKK